MNPADTLRGGSGRGALDDWLLESARPGQHLVQLYGNGTRGLIRNVCRYFRAGLRRGEGLLAVATLEHSAAFAAELRSDPRYQQAVREGRLLFLDALSTMARLMVDGRPSWDRFEAVVGGALQELESRVGQAGFRIYGEMVAILWNEGRSDAALRLEEFWNLALDRYPASLLCAYPVDLFAPDAETDGIEGLVHPHTHVVPGSAGRKAGLERAMIEVLGDVDVDSASVSVCLPKAEALALYLRSRFPDRAAEILRRAQVYDSESA